MLLLTFMDGVVSGNYIKNIIKQFNGAEGPTIIFDVLVCAYMYYWLICIFLLAYTELTCINEAESSNSA